MSGRIGQKMSGIPQSRYFQWRRVTPEMYADYQLPAYFEEVLPEDRSARIVDFGCGFGQVMSALRALGYTNLVGIDVEPEALQHCRKAGLEVHDNTDGEAILRMVATADLIIMSHIIEHFPKTAVIPLLESARRILKPGGKLFVMVPNAQAFTGCYWAYEDFTHEMLFTSGSLYYVLKAAGFGDVRFVDMECLAGCGLTKKVLRKVFLTLYRFNYAFWSKVTASSWHRPSELIFSYEIKAIASPAPPVPKEGAP
jgi:SAM-dependent methyltransferase